MLLLFLGYVIFVCRTYLYVHVDFVKFIGLQKRYKSFIPSEYFVIPDFNPQKATLDIRT